jgi:hypothetical protein
LLFNPKVAFAGDSPNTVCWKILHEYGHLAGLHLRDTFDDECSIMYGGARIIFESGPFHEAFQGQGWCQGSHLSAEFRKGRLALPPIEVPV